MERLLSNLLNNAEKPGLGRRIIDVVLTFSMFLAVSLLLFTLSFSLCPVSGESMMPTIVDGQYALLNRWDAEYSRGEIIVFNKGENMLIKRIIGVPGDKIEIRYKTDRIHLDVYRNGEKLVEDYVNEEMTAWWVQPQYVSAYGVNIDVGEPVTVPENCYCVLGDNRNHSLDSRVRYEQVDHSVELGFVSYGEIVGSVACFVPKDTPTEWTVRLIFGDLWEVKERN